jgi:serine/threonine protein kinase
MPVDLARIEEIFGEAVTKTGAARAAYLDEACAGDAELRQRVEQLLAAQDATANFLRLPDTNGGTTPYVPVTEGPKSKIGRYKLLEQIGEGGFGVVFMAEQEEPVRRLVALKIIKLGMDTRQVVARFEAERQALAMMDHPSVAKVLDGGATDTGRPYFVMELVKGIPITDYCDKHQLTIPKRLELFSQVCQAVQHAHQKGLIHRDLKPSNVLVSTQDDRPVAKVIDFGVAKAMQARLTERTLFTEFQQLVGTPAYMSPEQADGSLDIDTRSDVYSLGVLLYELLTGSTPFDPKELRSKAFAELQRFIREVEPPNPSMRLSTMTDTLPSVAAHRSIEPRKLASTIRGELDWIVMKCLEKDRNRRYETPSSLASDIEHYLHDEPVQACPPSALYRLRKYARRNKVAIAFIAVLAAASVFLGLSNIALKRERDAKTLALARANAFADSLQKMLYSSNPDPINDPKFSVPVLLKDFSTRLGDERAGEEAHRLVRRVIDEYGQVAIDYPNDFDRRLKALSGYVQTIGQCVAASGFAGEVDELNRRLDEGLPKLVADFHDSSDSQWNVALLYRHWAWQLLPYREYASTTVRTLRESIRFHEKASQSDAKRPGAWLCVADRNIVLGYVLWCTARPEDAEAAYRRAIDVFDQHESEIAADKVYYASEINSDFVWLAYYLGCTHRNNRAAEFARKSALYANGLTDPSEAADALHRTALVQLRLGDHAGYRETCTAMVDLPLLRASDRMRALTILTWCLAPDAIEDLRLPLKRAEELVAHNSFDRPYTIPYVLGAALYCAGHYERAAVELEKAIAVYPNNPNPEHPSPYFQQLFLAMTKWQLGKREEARRLLAEIQPAIDERVKALSTSLYNRLSLEILRREAEALIEPKEVDEAVEKKKGTKSPTTDN